MSVSAKCRVCNGSAAADSFKLHHDFRQMVCPNCFSGRTQKKILEEKKKSRELKTKPPGWDADDAYLEKAASMRKEEIKGKFTKIAGTNYVRCECLSCKYNFRYDPFRKKPRSCPYCDTEIPRLRTFNLL